MAFADWSSTSSPSTYTLLSWHNFFSDVALPELHSIVEMHIHELLATGFTAISFTTDIWTSDVSPMSMLSLTAQRVDEDFLLRKAVLLKNVLVLIPLLPFQWHLRRCLKHEHPPSAMQTTDWRNKLINCVCSRRDALCHGIGASAADVMPSVTALERLLNKTADTDRGVNLEKYFRL